MDKEILKEIGLTDYESKIYISLLTHGQISAYELAEKTGLYRQVTYDTLKRLQEKGYVNTVIQDKTRLFKAIDPNLILEILNEKTQNFQQILPELNILNNASKQPLSVETYKGNNIR